MLKQRCDWCIGDKLYEDYHDQEWGVPVYDDKKLFEFLILETFQAGLSWITVLRKRENFRKAFDNFSVDKIAHYNQSKIDSLMQNSGIIRNKLKIKASISNAQAFIKIQDHFGSFSNYLWRFTEGKPVKNAFKNLKDLPASTVLSEAISKDLKQHGFKFVGSTIIYAYIQAIGLVNDHLIHCFRYEIV
jgi:DNA-3-methyladenine glycosylase I